MSISDYLENKLLDAVFNSVPFSVAGNPYISLHTADPGLDGGFEVAGSRYVRQQADFTLADGGSLDVAATIEFPNMPTITIIGVGVWDARRRGNYLWGGLLDSPVNVAEGNTFRLPAGSLKVALI